jgi:hypothetical protein
MNAILEALAHDPNVSPALQAALIPPGNATCPKCNGTTRRPADESARRYRIATYDEATDTLACDNCGGQTMSLDAKGHTRIDPATGLGCLHDWRRRLAGNCYHEHTCRKCGSQFYIDSSD